MSSTAPPSFSGVTDLPPSLSREVVAGVIYLGRVASYLRRHTGNAHQHKALEVFYEWGIALLAVRNGRRGIGISLVYDQGYFSTGRVALLAVVLFATPTPYANV